MLDSPRPWASVIDVSVLEGIPSQMDSVESRM